MSKKLWSGLIAVFIIFLSLQIISNARKRALEDSSRDVPEVIVDMSTLNAPILAEELVKKKEKATEEAPPEVNLQLPKSVGQIQKALKTAGFNPGPIDGKLGPKTKAAIRAFQKTHDLKIDGKIGRNTWKILRRYLE